MKKRIVALFLFVAIVSGSFSVLEAARESPCNKYLGHWEMFFDLGCSLESGNCCHYD